MSAQHDLAERFLQIADLLEIRGENPFRIRAYRRAAESLERFGGDLAALASAGRLRELAGVGSDLAQRIEEYLTTGRLAMLEDLAQRAPRGVFDLLAVPGVGPKTVRLLTERLKIGSVRELERAITAGRLRRLPGFQAKKEQNLLKGIAVVTKGRERMTLDVALALADELVAFLKRVPGATRVSPAGSLRRMRETIGDLDLLVASARPQRVMKAFTTSRWAGRILAAGTTKASIVTADGLQVDLRVVEPAAYGAALQYFTGSKEHNVRLRELAARRGLKLNEYGVFRGTRRLASREEAEVYRAVGLPWIPPEIREDAGELDAAQAGRLPHLVEAADIRGDFHIHTTYSDGHDGLEQVVDAGRARGYRHIAICDHSQSLRVAHGMSVARIREQMARIRALNGRFRGFRVLLGSEVDILEDGRLDYPNAVLADLDFVVASVHSGLRQDRATLTRRIVRAMQNPYVTVVGHPTGRRIGLREPYALDLEAVIRAAHDTSTALELNASPDRLDLSDAAARRARDAGVMLAIGTDTHRIAHYAHMRLGLGLARRAWVGPSQLLNCQTTGDLLAWIRRKRQAAGAARRS